MVVKADRELEVKADRELEVEAERMRCRHKMEVHEELHVDGAVGTRWQKD